MRATAKVLHVRPRWLLKGVSVNKVWADTGVLGLSIIRDYSHLRLSRPAANIIWHSDALTRPASANVSDVVNVKTWFQSSSMTTVDSTGAHHRLTGIAPDHVLVPDVVDG